MEGREWVRCSAAWDHNYSSEAVGTVHVLPGKGGGICSSGPLARSQLPTDKPLAGLRTGCAKLPFSFCVLLEGFASLHPQRGRPRWPAKNKPEQWKLKPKEITSESFVLLKYLQYCCSDDGQLFPFPISYSTSPYLGFTTLLLINTGCTRDGKKGDETGLQSSQVPGHLLHFQIFCRFFWWLDFAKCHPRTELGEEFCWWKPAEHRDTAPPWAQQRASCLPSVLLVAVWKCTSSCSSSPPPPSPAFSPHTCIISVRWSCLLNFFCAGPQLQAVFSPSQISLRNFSPSIRIVPWISTIQPNHLLSFSWLIVRCLGIIVFCSLNLQGCLGF